MKNLILVAVSLLMLSPAMSFAQCPSEDTYAMLAICNKMSNAIGGSYVSSMNSNCLKKAVNVEAAEYCGNLVAALKNEPYKENRFSDCLDYIKNMASKNNSTDSSGASQLKIVSRQGSSGGVEAGQIITGSSQEAFENAKTSLFYACQSEKLNLKPSSIQKISGSCAYKGHSMTSVYVCEVLLTGECI